MSKNDPEWSRVNSGSSIMNGIQIEKALEKVLLS
jgi:hypothetical protein